MHVERCFCTAETVAMCSEKNSSWRKWMYRGGRLCKDRSSARAARSRKSRNSLTTMMQENLLWNGFVLAGEATTHLLSCLMLLTIDPLPFAGAFMYYTTCLNPDNYCNVQSCSPCLVSSKSLFQTNRRMINRAKMRSIGRGWFVRF